MKSSLYVIFYVQLLQLQVLKIINKITYKKIVKLYIPITWINYKIN